MPRNTAEGQADGTVVTTGVLTGDTGSGDALGSYGGTAGRVTFATAAAKRGNRGYAIAALADTETAILLTPTWTTVDAAALQVWFYVSGGPASSCIALAIRHTSGNAAALTLLPVGAFVLQDSTGSNVGAAPTTALPAGWYLLDLRAVKGTTTSNGTLAAQVKNEAGTVVYSASTTTGNASTNQLASGRVGYLSSAGTKPAARVDDFGWDPGATAFMALPITAPAATVRPSGVAANPGAWVNDAGAAPTGSALSDESDTTYNTNPGAADGESITYSLPPLSAGTVQIQVRMLKPGTAGAPPVRVELLEGSTVRATRNVVSTTSTAAFDSGTGIADYVLDLTGTESSSITDRSVLGLRLTATPA